MGRYNEILQAREGFCGGGSMVWCCVVWWCGGGGVLVVMVVMVWGDVIMQLTMRGFDDSMKKEP